MGAWIETPLELLDGTIELSHPVWVRGLKRAVGAVGCRGCRSHPVWVRGLKHGESKLKYSDYGSHPVWVRGLKL